MAYTFKVMIDKLKKDRNWGHARREGNATWMKLQEGNLQAGENPSWQWQTSERGE